MRTNLYKVVAYVPAGVKNTFYVVANTTEEAQKKAENLPNISDVESVESFLPVNL